MEITGYSTNGKDTLTLEYKQKKEFSLPNTQIQEDYQH